MIFDMEWEAWATALTFVGMSNIGKSWLASRIAENIADAKMIEVDHYIREELDQKSMSGFADWLGQPNSPGYAEREARSLAIEERATLRALDELPPCGILDTTGSVIYCPESCARLVGETDVVYLRASEKQRKTLEKLYFSNPKPLNWAGHFNQRNGESFEDAVIRCYPELLDSRDQAYMDLADHVVCAEAIYATSDPHDLFNLVKPTR